MKRGGVCSLRLYGESAGAASQIEQEGLRTLCPLRFEEDSEVLRWVGEVILGTQSPRIVTQVGFLRGETGGSDVGRIDMVLVNDPPGPSFDWCALEMQAVYFSGAVNGKRVLCNRSARGTKSSVPGWPETSRLS